MRCAEKGGIIVLYAKRKKKKEKKVVYIIIVYVITVVVLSLIAIQLVDWFGNSTRKISRIQEMMAQIGLIGTLRV